MAVNLFRYRRPRQTSPRDRSNPLLLRPHPHKRSFPSLASSTLHHDEAHKISAIPIAAVGAQHVQVLNLERARAGAEEVVDLHVVVQEQELLLGNLLFGEVVRLELDGGGEARHVWLLWSCRGAMRGRARGGIEAEGGDEFIEEGWACARDDGGFKGKGIGAIDS